MGRASGREPGRLPPQPERRPHHPDQQRGQPGAITDGAITDGAITDGAITDGDDHRRAITDGAITYGAITSGAVTADGTAKVSVNGKAL